jgi:LCP family protein required for cell wall assembly
VRRFFIAIVAVGLVVLIVREDAPPPPEPPAIELHRTAAAAFFEPSKTPVLFVLIIGSDVREGNPSGGRADSLHLLAVNAAKRGGTLIGIPRDSYVPIPGSGTEKINASLFFGGPGRVVDTVSRLAGVPIHYWALVEFSRFRKLVDALGGVEVPVPYAMSDPLSGASFKPGKNKMNGEQALAFSRARKTVPGGDFGRSSNQGRVLLGALEKFRHDASNPLSLAKYLLAFDQLVETDVKTSELLDLATIGRRLRPWKIRNIVLPGGGGNVGGASVVHLAPGANDIFKKIRDDALL